MQKSPRSSAITATERVAARRWPGAGLLAGLVLVLGLFGVATSTVPSGSAQASGPCSAASCVGLADPVDRAAADPSPTPTLGSTESPNPNPPGDNDADASDFSGTLWILPAVFILAGIGGTVYWLRTRSRNRNN